MFCEMSRNQCSGYTQTGAGGDSNNVSFITRCITALCRVNRYCHREGCLRYLPPPLRHPTARFKGNVYFELSVRWQICNAHDGVGSTYSILIGDSDILTYLRSKLSLNLNLSHHQLIAIKGDVRDPGRLLAHRTIANPQRNRRARIGLTGQRKPITQLFWLKHVTQVFKMRDLSFGNLTETLTTGSYLTAVGYRGILLQC